MRVFNTTYPARTSSQFFLALVAFKCVFFLLGILGNAAVLIYHAFVDRNRTPSACFVANLACADLLVCLTVYPTWIVHIVLIVSGVDGSSKFTCQFAYASASMSISLSALALLAITYDRYIFIVQPLHYLSVMTWKKTFTIVASIWIFASATIPMSMFTGVLDKGKQICGDAPRGAVWIAIGFADVPTAFVVYFNLKIFKIARQQTRRIAEVTKTIGGQNENVKDYTSRRGNMKGMKAVKTFACITGVLLCCYVPFSIMLVVEYIVCNACVPEVAHFLILDLIGINSVVNAYIYGLRHREYRNGFRKILCALFTCRFSRCLR